MIKIKLALYIFLFLNITNELSPVSVLFADSKTFHVNWVGEFRSTENWNEDTGLATKLFNLIMGDAQVDLIRPVNVYFSNQTFWILDQGSKTLNYFDLENKESELIYDKDDNLFPSLVGICGDGSGKIYFTDSQNNQILKISTEYKELTNLTGNVKLTKPTGIAYSLKTNNIYVCETGNHRVLEMKPNGEITNSIGSRGLNKGEFNFPTHIWIDKNGLIYIVDSMNFRVQIFNEKRKLISVFGEAGDGTGYLARPKGIATDSYGHIYIVDALFHNVQVFNRNGDFLYNFGEQGSGEGEFWLPT
ncbi:MAG: hypothetical protein KAS18_06395, partial [Calditrichia bacterium]|nr:hypothetical protein [Calditrichia bacterium]